MFLFKDKEYGSWIGLGEVGMKYIYSFILHPYS